MHMQDVFNNGEINELLRWKDLSFAILDQTLQIPFLFHKSFILAGGVYTSWHHKESIKDYDVFILGDGYEEQILAYLKSKMGIIFEYDSFKDTSDYKRDNTNIEKVYNVKTIHNAKFQFIFTKYKTREELISHFDYLHCTPNYYDGKLYVRRDAFESIRDKKLVVHNKDNQVEWRRNKFLKLRGFTESVIDPEANLPWHLRALKKVA